MNQPKAIFSWSGGKDSAYALHKILTEKLFDVKYLLTTVNKKYNRISMHGVREELLHLQAASIGIPLLKVWVKEGTNEEYERQMETVLLKVKAEDIHHVIFGDIFLEDLRAYRENNLAKAGMKGIFPLWKMDTKEIILDFLDKGFKTITCCVNDGYLSEDWPGREVDDLFITDLPSYVDPCGEHGEFHTFCFDGPIFKRKIPILIGEKIYRPIEIKKDDVCTTKVETKGFWFCDLYPKNKLHEKIYRS